MRTSYVYALAGCSIALPGLGWLTVVGLVRDGPTATCLFFGMVALSLTSATAGLTLAYRWKSDVSATDKGLCTALVIITLILNGVAATFCLMIWALAWALAAFELPIGFD